MFRRLLVILFLLPVATAVAAEQSLPSADEIMARVAENQDLAQKLRAEYVYQQHIKVTTRRPNGKLVREETADYQVTPTPKGTQRELKQLAGKYWFKHDYVNFLDEASSHRDSLDGDLVQDFRNDCTNDESKDGIARYYFPLTSSEQKKYLFSLKGVETHHGREVYRLMFVPRDKSDLTWAGEALIDAEEFEPMSVITGLSRRVPLWIRTVLGTDVPGLGFNVEYRRFEDGVWFPVSFGTEFRLRAVFFINRVISISLENTDFQHTRVHSEILGIAPVP